MNETVSKTLSAENKFKPKMHLSQPWFTYSVCKPFTKNKKEYKNYEE